MNILKSLISGVAGACALTLLHETARRKIEAAPRADVLGMRALKKMLHIAGRPAPAPKRLHKWALLGDIISNSLYYSAVGLGAKQGSWLRGAMLGLGAGLGALTLPGPMGLGEKPTNRTAATQLMTVAWYVVGGLVAAASTRLLSRASNDQ